MNRRKTAALAAAAGLALIGAMALRAGRSHAADHLDPPARTDPGTAMMPNTAADRNADIADVYAWTTGAAPNQNVVLALTYAGPNARTEARGRAVPCDRDVLYTIHVDTTGDAVAELNIRARFANDVLPNGMPGPNCFVRWEGLPGVSTPQVAPVELTRTFSGIRTFVGVRDDAFFFDLQGFRDTLATGNLSMTNDRDFFAGLNTPVMVLEAPLSVIRPTGTTPLRVWATTARIGS